jgi:MFS family permease
MRVEDGTAQPSVTRASRPTAVTSSEDESRSAERVTQRHRRAFTGAFGGWLLDGYNAGLFGLVLGPSLTELLPRSGYEVTPANIAFFGQLGVALFLLGWGCSLVWGPIADRFGRLPALMASILVYAFFTFLAGFAQDVWQLNALRFVAAIGIGGEWAIAGTFVSESMPERWRVRSGGLLHSGAFWGLLMGAMVNLAIGPLVGWRWMLFLGALPALFVLYIRATVRRDSDRWEETAATRRRPGLRTSLAQVVRPPYRARSVGNAALVTVALLGFWASSQYLPISIRQLALSQGTEPGRAGLLGTLGVALLAFTTALTCLGVPYLCERLGRRRALAVLFALMIVGISGGYGWAYPQGSLPLFFAFLVVMGVGGAHFAVFTIWLPEQYPTAVRASGFAFSTAVSRFVAAVGTFAIGAGFAAVGIALPLALTAVPFLLGFLLLRHAPETRGQGLPG